MILLSSLTFIFWFSMVAVIAMVISLENEKNGLASMFFSLVIGLLLWNYSSDILGYITENYLAVIGFGFSYILIGIGWSFFKWNSKVKDIFKRLGQYKNSYADNRGVFTESALKAFNKKIDGKFRNSDNSGFVSLYDTTPFEDLIKKIKPSGDSYKANIVSWISYWPLSILGTLVNNPFRKFFGWVYDQVSGSYDRMTKNQMDKYLK